MESSRGSLVLDYVRKFNVEKETEGKKETVEHGRMYNLVIPLGAPYEEIYEVLDMAKEDIKKMDSESKRLAAEAAAAQEAAVDIESSVE